MDALLRNLVRQRAGDRCEYCQLPQASLPFVSFHVDHVVPRQHGGQDELSNLAWSCGRCNRKRGPNLSGIDPDTGQVVTLFNPRTQVWNDHFVMRGVEILGLTPTGRACVRLLDLNGRRRLQLREELEASGEL